MSLSDIGPNTTMGEILSAYPSAKLGLFRGNMAGGLETWPGEVEASCEAPLTASVPGTQGPEPGT